MKTTILKTTALFLFLLLSSQGNAQLFQNLMLGNAKALGLGQAVTADPPGIDAIHFNPAGLTRLKGRQVGIKVLAADFSLVGRFDLNNPKVIKRYEELGFSDPLDGQTSNIENLSVYLPFLGFTDVPVPIAPLGGVSFNREGSKWTFANSIYAPMAFGFSRADDDPGNVHGKKLAFTILNYFNPAVGYQLTNTLSVGFALNFAYSALMAEVNYRNSGGVLIEISNLLDQACGRTPAVDYTWTIPAEVLNICGGDLSPHEGLFDFRAEMEDDFSVGYTIGILWDATNWLSLGVVYQAEKITYLTGFMELDFRDMPDFGLLGLISTLAENQVLEPILGLFDIPQDGLVREHAEFKLTTPQHLAFGMSMRILPRLKLNIDVKWTETSTWESLPFEADENVGIFTLFTVLQIDGAGSRKLWYQRDYVDTVNWGFGLEFMLNERTDLRLGFEPRKTGIPDNKRDFTVPVADIDVIAVGFSRKVSKTSVFDFTIAAAKSEMFVPAGSSTNGNDHTNINNFIYHPTSGLDLTSKLEILLIETNYRKHF